MSEWTKKAGEWLGEDSNVPIEEILQVLSRDSQYLTVTTTWADNVVLVDRKHLCH